MLRPLGLALASLALVLASGAMAVQTPVPVSACTMQEGETACDFLCAPGALAVAAQGPPGAWVRATCGTASLACTVLFDTPCWGLTNQGNAGLGRCTSSGASLATCASA